MILLEGFDDGRVSGMFALGVDDVNGLVLHVVNEFTETLVLEELIEWEVEWLHSQNGLTECIDDKLEVPLVNAPAWEIQVDFT